MTIVKVATITYLCLFTISSPGGGGAGDAPDSLLFSPILSLDLPGIKQFLFCFPFHLTEKKDEFECNRYFQSDRKQKR